MQMREQRERGRSLEMVKREIQLKDESDVLVVKSINGTLMLRIEQIEDEKIEHLFLTPLGAKLEKNPTSEFYLFDLLKRKEHSDVHKK